LQCPESILSVRDDWHTDPQHQQCKSAISQLGLRTRLRYQKACATGSTGLHLARNTVRYGGADVVLVIGFEQMSPGAIKDPFENLPSPMELPAKIMEETRGRFDSPRTAQYFANAGKAYMEK
jgi:acetyl-CoA acetyltransferase